MEALFAAKQPKSLVPKPNALTPAAPAAAGASPTVGASPSGDGLQGPPKKKGEAKLTVLGVRRANNVGIFLAKLRGLTVEHLCAAVHRLDETVLQVPR